MNPLDFMLSIIGPAAGPVLAEKIKSSRMAAENVKVTSTLTLADMQRIELALSLLVESHRSTYVEGPPGEMGSAMDAALRLNAVWEQAKLEELLRLVQDGTKTASESKAAVELGL